MADLRQTRSQDVDLGALLAGIESGQVVLPNFQRDFDWTDVDVRALIGTIISGWPIGSLLLIEGGAHREFYDPRPVDGAPPVSSDIVYIILDGQQRLTALYHALRDRGEIVYALKLAQDRTYGDIDALDDALVGFKRNIWSRHAAPSEQWAAGYLPIAALRDAPTFFAWRDDAIGRDAVEDRRRITEIYTDFLSGIHNYRVPAVIIDSRIEPAAVARVFERVNRTGMKLGTFDLMVAKSFSDGFNLRALWEQARSDRPALRRFMDEDGLPVLNVLALRQQGDVRQSAVLALSGPSIRDGWADATRHFENALDFAMRELGILYPDWLPYRQILTVLAAIDYDFPLASQRDLLVRWYWATVFGRRYDAASNTRAVSDFKKLRLLEDPIRSSPLLISEILIESTRGQQGALHRAYLTAVAASLGAEIGFDKTVDGDGNPLIAIQSTYKRGDSPGFEPPLHLRTLTFSARPKDGSTSEIEFDSSELTPTGDGSPGTFLEERLARLAEFISVRVMEPVKVVSSSEVDLETAE